MLLEQASQEESAEQASSTMSEQVRPDMMCGGEVRADRHARKKKCDDMKKNNNVMKKKGR
eukprot:15924438-Heterocapsa_arctica.AAC.1